MLFALKRKYSLVAQLVKLVANSFAFQISKCCTVKPKLFFLLVSLQVKLASFTSSGLFFDTNCEKR